MKKILIITGAAIVGASLILAAMPAMARPTVEVYVGRPAVYVQTRPVYVERIHGNWGERRWHEQHARGYRDRDHDGIPNRFDRDRDGDGVPNRFDRRPDNPYRY